jgi:mRNA interferase RelE/StbE
VAVLGDWNYVVLKPALKYLEKMQSADQIRIIEALDTLLNDPNSLDIKQLKGRPENRLRVGKYRVLFFKDLEQRTYVITTIGARGDVYK